MCLGIQDLRRRATHALALGQGKGHRHSPFLRTLSYVWSPTPLQPCSVSNFLSCDAPTHPCSKTFMQRHTYVDMNLGVMAGFPGPSKESPYQPHQPHFVSGVDPRVSQAPGKVQGFRRGSTRKTCSSGF